MDHYSTLGISKDATPEEIKKAYRRLASKHHPDKGGDADEFRKIQEAYEILIDPITKGSYDNPHRDDNFSEFFSSAFRNEFSFTDGMFTRESYNRGRQQQRNPDAVVNLTISMLQAYNGTDLTIDTGFSKENIHITPGTRDGARLRVSQKGYHRFKDVPPGDLVVRVKIEYPEGIERDDDDIYQLVDIGAIDAMVGSEIVVKHFSGKQLKVKIPAGSQSGSKLRLSNWGMPNPVNSNHRGNLFLMLNIKIPVITNPEHIDLLNKINNEVKV